MSTRRWRVMLCTALALALIALVLATGALGAPPATGSVKGTVTGFDGAKLAGSRVVAFRMTGTYPHPDYNAEQVAEVVTNKKGAYKLTLPPGTYKLGIFPANSVKYAFEYYPNAAMVWLGDDIAVVAKSKRTINVRLEAAARIGGTVCTTEGEPLAGMQVTILQQWPSQLHDLATVTTGTDGAFDFTGLPAGGYWVWVSDPAEYYAPNDSTWIEVATGEQATDLCLPLQAGGVIEGRVTDEAGNPVAGMGVALGQDPYYWDHVAWAETDEDGYYRFLQPAGTYRVQFLDWNGLGYLSEWYDDQLDGDEAMPLTIVAGDVLSDIDAVVSEPAWITGRVTNESGEGIADIDVAAHIVVNDEPRYIQSANTDENGYYELPVPADTPVLVAFRDFNYNLYFEEWYDDVHDWPEATLVSASHGLPHGNVDAVLAIGAHVRGRVTNEAGEPIAYLGVGAEAPAENPEEGLYGVSGTETDEDGYYDLMVPEGSYFISLGSWNSGPYLFEYYDDASHWEDATLVATSVDAPAENIDAVLAEGALINGRVTNEAGEGIGGIGVNAYLTEAPNPDDGPPHVSGTETDDEGYYTLVVPRGEFLVDFSDYNNNAYLGEWYDNVGPDWQQATPVSTAIGAPADNIDAVLAEGVHIRGRVTNESGEPIAWTGVNACEPPENPGDEPPGVQGTETDEDGYYDILVPEGTYYMHFAEWNAGPYLSEWYDDVFDHNEASTVFAAPGAPAEDVDAVLSVGAIIRGRVTDQSGEPIAGIDAAADAFAENPDEGTYRVNGTQTDELGYYTVVVPEGEYVIGFGDWSDERYLSEWYDNVDNTDEAVRIQAAVGAPVENIDAVLAEGAHIRGRVTNSAGDPVAYLGVGIHVAPGAGEDGPKWINGAETDDDGYFDALVPEGTYLVMAGAWNNDAYFNEWYDEASDWNDATGVVTSVLTPAENVDFVLEAASIIEGTVTDETGNPIAGVGVSAAVPGAEPWQVDFRAHAGTDANGHYRILVSPDTYWVHFSAQDPNVWASEWYDDQYTARLGLPVVVGAEETVEGVNATLSAPGLITGRVTDESGNPIPGLAVVNAVEVAQDQWDWFNQARTDENGVYTLACRPGQVLVGFVDQSGYWAMQWYPGAGWPGGGVLQTVTAGGTLGGIDAVMEPVTP